MSVFSDTEIRDSKMKDVFSEDRLGRFSISRKFILNFSYKELLDFMSQVFVIEAKFNIVTCAIDYIAFSEIFDPNEPFKEAPWYDVVTEEVELPNGVMVKLVGFERRID